MCDRRDTTGRLRLLVWRPIKMEIDAVRRYDARIRSARGSECVVSGPGRWQVTTASDDQVRNVFFSCLSVAVGSVQNKAHVAGGRSNGVAGRKEQAILVVRRVAISCRTGKCSKHGALVSTI